MKNFKKIITIALSCVFLTNAIVFGAAAASRPKTVYLGGQPFGVRFYNSGVIIIDTEDFFDGEKYVCPAKSSGLEINDVITAVNGTRVKTNEDLQQILFGSGGQELEFTVERDKKQLTKRVTPVKNTVGVYLLGAWVRDSCAGIGTVTYYDDDKNVFSALGHGICDNDTSALLPLGEAEVVRSNVSGVTKSSVGSTGSLNGYFTDRVLGHLTKNTDLGVFGTTTDNFYQNYPRVEIAGPEEFSTGKAEIFSATDGTDPQRYEIEIRRLCNKSAKSNENFVIKVTDERLLQKCGGIVQGMSGSPIVKDGKLLGAVTHVFINRPDEGYGVFAQNMVSYYEE